MRKISLSILPLVGAGAGLGAVAYGLKKTWQYLSGDENSKDIKSGAMEDRSKLIDFEKDFNEFKMVASECRGINELMANNISDFIKAVDFSLPGMRKQIEMAEGKEAKEKNKLREKEKISMPGSSSSEPSAPAKKLVEKSDSAPRGEKKPPSKSS
jgi:hypothetical protein